MKLESEESLMPQERISHHHESQDEPEVAETPTENIKTEGIDEDVDSILEEIDDVLETNAEDFVKAFIQKGGQ